MRPIPDLPLIGGYLPTSFLDWQGRVTAVVFVKGCNFRCPFCHNAPLLTGMAEGLDPLPVLADVEKRRMFLDGVVVSGGEPTLYPGLPGMLSWFRDEARLPVKLDTNGSCPEALETLLSLGLVRAVAMDVKAPWEKYGELAGVPVDTEKVRKSLELLRPLGESLELRTTFVPGLMTVEDLKKIREQLGNDARWVVQLFQPANALDPVLREIPAPSRESIAAVLEGVRVRG